MDVVLVGQAGINDLPTDVLVKIFEFVHLKGEEYNSLPHSVFKRNFFLPLRLVCKRWNHASKSCWVPWSKLLDNFGPRKINEKGDHHSRFQSKPCRKNEKGVCILVAHYEPEGLIPVYSFDNALTATSAYNACMDVFSHRQKKKSISAIKRSERRLLTLRLRLDKITKDIESEEKYKASQEMMLEKCEEFHNFLKVSKREKKKQKIKK